MVEVKYRAGIWAKLMELWRGQRFWMDRIAADLDITPQMMIALNEIPAAGSITMKELAGLVLCDASNATGLIDRLEARGLVERRAAEKDRRVKCIALTAAGKRMRRKITERINALPPAIDALSRADQTKLDEILGRALENVYRLRAAGNDQSSADMKSRPIGRTMSA